MSLWHAREKENPTERARPSLYVPENAVIKTPKIELKRYITSTPEVRNFILKRRSENISLREKEEEYEELFVKNFLV